MTKRSFIKGLLAFILTFVFAALYPVVSYADTSSVSPGQTAAPVEKPVLSGENLVVVKSVETGQILFDSSSGAKVSPTVTAKLVACMVVFDSVSSLDETVQIPPEAILAQNIGRKGDVSAPMLGLTPGTSQSVRVLLSAALVSAANDACFSLAHYVSGGDIPAFVEKMNEKAASIGCMNTLYTTPVGLNDQNAYTTPRDAAAVAAAFYKYNTLLNISHQATYMMGNTIHTKNYLLSDTLLAGYTLPEAKGMIAGQSRPDGGYCLVTSAEKAGLGYVFVVMEAPGEIRNPDGTREFPPDNAYDNIHEILPWATSSFGYLTLVSHREIMGELPVSVASGNTDHISYVANEEVDMLMPVGTLPEDVTREEFLYYESLEAPVEKNMIVGRIDFYHDGEKIASVSLITSGEIERSKLLSLLTKLKGLLMSPKIKTAVRVIIVILVAYFILVTASLTYRVILKANAAAREREKRLSKGKKPTPASEEGSPRRLPPEGGKQQTPGRKEAKNPKKPTASSGAVNGKKTKGE